MLTDDRQANLGGAGQAAMHVGSHQDHEAEFGFALGSRCFMKACVLGKDENSQRDWKCLETEPWPSSSTPRRVAAFDASIRARDR